MPTCREVGLLPSRWARWTRPVFLPGGLVEWAQGWLSGPEVSVPHLQAPWVSGLGPMGRSLVLPLPEAPLGPGDTPPPSDLPCVLRRLYPPILTEV